MEILAPCGSPEHVRAAVFAGADAIYLGGPGFSARRNAVNFTLQDLREALDFCRGFGVRLYVAVNILTADGEWDEMCAYVKALADLGPDALIVQDVGVAKLCHHMAHDMPLHASTQLSVHSPDGVAFCREMGFERVVIARECDRNMLEKITAGAGIGIEVFVHGALCVSLSGQCALSAAIGGRSGNRGLCAQPCRMDFGGGGRSFALSLKDLSLMDDVPALQAMGVCSLKIEGRMKRPEYVAAAVHACRAAREGREVDEAELRAVFSREGFTRGYFIGNHADMGGVRGRQEVADTAAILPQLAERMRAPTKRVPVEVAFAMAAGEECSLTLSDGQDAVTVQGDVPVAGRAMEVAEIERLLRRMGSTPFEVAGMAVDAAPGLQLPASRINALRREGCEALLAKGVARRTPDYPCGEALPLPMGRVQGPEPRLRVHCRTLEQARAVAGVADEIVVAPDIARAGGLPVEKVIVAPPRFVADEAKLKDELQALAGEGINRLLCRNPAHVVAGRSLGLDLHGGLGLNLFNGVAAGVWQDFGLRDLTASMELRLAQAKAIGGGLPVGVAAYGRLPLMLLVRCPFGCACHGGKCPGALTDRTNRRFPVRCHGDHCEMVNADVLWMADRLEQLRGVGFLSLLLDDEGPERAVEVVRAYREGGPPPQGHTRGLLVRGVQ